MKNQGLELAVLLGCVVFDHGFYMGFGSILCSTEGAEPFPHASLCLRQQNLKGSETAGRRNVIVDSQAATGEILRGAR